LPLARNKTINVECCYEASTCKFRKASYGCSLANSAFACKRPPTCKENPATSAFAHGRSRSTITSCCDGASERRARAAPFGHHRYEAASFAAFKVASSSRVGVEHETSTRGNEHDSRIVAKTALVQTFGRNETNARDHCAAQAARTAFQTAGALLSLIRSLPSVN